VRSAGHCIASGPAPIALPAMPAKCPPRDEPGNVPRDELANLAAACTR
jgi:hypothetical protein